MEILIDFIQHFGWWVGAILVGLWLIGVYLPKNHPHRRD